MYFGDPELGLAFCATAMMTIALCVAKISTSYCRFETSAEIAFQKTKRNKSEFFFCKAAVFTLYLLKRASLTRELSIRAGIRAITDKVHEYVDSSLMSNVEPN